MKKSLEYWLLSQFEHKFNLFVYLKIFEVNENMYSETVDILTISVAILLTAVTEGTVT